jgi:hypothetical protein
MNRSEIFFEWFDRVEEISKLNTEIDEDYFNGPDFKDHLSTIESLNRTLILGSSKILRTLRIRLGLGT